MIAYYPEERECTLLKRDQPGYAEPFNLESPNGINVFDYKIEETDSSGYIDASGNARKSFTEYTIVLTFYYSSHRMNLEKLLEADEIIIPYSFDLNPANEVSSHFILDNREVVFNYLSGLYLGVDGDDIKGGVKLVFKSTLPFKRSELFGGFGYSEPDPASGFPDPEEGNVDVLLFFQQSITVNETQYITQRVIEEDIQTIMGPYYGLPDSYIDTGERHQTAGETTSPDGDLHIAHRYSNDTLVYQKISPGGSWSAPQSFGQSKDYRYIGLQSYAGNLYIMYVDATTGLPKIWRKNQNDTINVELPSGASTVKGWGYSVDRNFKITDQGVMIISFYSNEVGLIVFTSNDLGLSWNHQIISTSGVSDFTVNNCNFIQVNISTDGIIFITYKDLSDSSIKQIRSDTWSFELSPETIKSGASEVESLSYFITDDNRHHLYLVNYGTGFIESWRRGVGGTGGWLIYTEVDEWVMPYPTGKFYAVNTLERIWWGWVKEELSDSGHSLFPSAPIVGMTPTGAVILTLDAPTDLTFEIVNGDIHFSWEGGGPNYNLYYTDANNDNPEFIRHNSATITTTSYIVDDLPNGNYYFRVHTVSGIRVSAPSNIVYVSLGTQDLLTEGNFYFLGQWRDPADNYLPKGIAVARTDYSMTDYSNPSTYSIDNFQYKKIDVDLGVTDIFHTRLDTKSFYMVRLGNDSLALISQGDSVATENWTGILLVDSNLNYIAHNRLDYDNTGYLNDGSSDVGHVLDVDEADNIYYVRPVTEAGASYGYEYRLFKYDSQLNEIWMSDIIDVSKSSSSVCDICVGKNNVLVWSSQSFSGRRLAIFRKSDGKKLEDRYSLAALGQRRSFCVVPDGRFFAIRGGSSSECVLFDERGNVLERKPVSEITGMYDLMDADSRNWTTWDPFSQKVIICDGDTSTGNNIQWLDIDTWTIYHQIPLQTQPFPQKISFLNNASVRYFNARALDGLAFQDAEGDISERYTQCFSHYSLSSTAPIGGTNGRYNPVTGGSLYLDKGDYVMGDNRYMLADTNNWILKTLPPVDTVPLPPSPNGLKFNGVDQYVDTGFFMGTNGEHYENYTIQFRFYSSRSSGHTVLGLIDPVSGNAIKLQLNIDNDENLNSPLIRVSGTDGTNKINTTQIDAILPDLNNAIPFHCTITCEKTVSPTLFYSIFINGYEYWRDRDFRIYDDTSLQQSSVPLFIGALNNQGSPDSLFKGAIDDFRFWTRKLTPSEILNNWKQPLNAINYATEYPDLLIYYKMNEATGDILVDETGNYNGSLVGNVNNNMWI